MCKDVIDSEIYDVTPPDEEEQKLLDRLQVVIEALCKYSNPCDSIDVRGVSFGDDSLDDFEDGIPGYVYCDIHTYDGCGGHTIEASVEYDVAILLEHEKEM